MKRVLITGISGQDGSFLAEYLLSLNYEVYGLVRRNPDSLRWIEPMRADVELMYGDMRDSESLVAAFQRAWPDEVYNLAGQVFVPTSWLCPAETFDMNVGGLARLLQIVEGQKRDTRVYQASSSEMYGNSNPSGACNEQTPFSPTSPYGTSKLAAHRLCEVYRGRGLFIVSGILFNHESPRRGPEMVTRKITRALASWACGNKTKLQLGNVHARRDWGFAGDYVRAMHAMLQQPTPRDYVIGTGESHSVGQFVELALNELARVSGSTRTNMEDIVEIDPRLLRTGEINEVRADATLARTELGWNPRVTFPSLVRMMIDADFAATRRALPLSDFPPLQALAD
jgi:GDPmannose 4,6-dehydratase